MTTRCKSRFQLTQVAGALTALVTGLVLVAGFGGQKAEAFPAFAKKEKKPCSYCHINAAGGGKKTPAGEYYKAHGNSFAGYGGSVPAPPTRPTKPLAKPKTTKSPVKPKTTAKKAPAKKP